MKNKRSLLFRSKLLVICGPTATGKTQLGFKLAKKFNGEIVSADSRQLYKFMDIGTGKEWNKEIKVWGYDLVDPKENYSVAEYFKEMKSVIEDIWNRNRIPIIVGGTGLYIKSLIDGIPTVDIPKNESLRESLAKMSIDEMFDKLAVLDSAKAAQLNSSDKKNPRRLIRAIEVAVWNTGNEKQKQVVDKRKKILDRNVDILMIGLTADTSKFLKDIENRVEKRMNEGFIDEVETLLKMGVSWKMQSMNTLGYKESEAFFKQGLSYEEFINLWISNEMKYVKRQLTWFKKDKRINWYDITDNKYPENVERFVNKWYHVGTNAEKS